MGRISLWGASTPYTKETDSFSTGCLSTGKNCKESHLRVVRDALALLLQMQTRRFTNLSQILLLLLIFQSHFPWLHHSGKSPDVTGICNLVHFLNAQPSVHPWIVMSWKEHTFLKSFVFEKRLKIGIWTRLRMWPISTWRSLCVKTHKSTVSL